MRWRLMSPDAPKLESSPWGRAFLRLQLAALALKASVFCALGHPEVEAQGKKRALAEVVKNGQIRREKATRDGVVSCPPYLFCEGVAWLACVLRCFLCS
jgi:hypothetical protein